MNRAPGVSGLDPTFVIPTKMHKLLVLYIARISARCSFFDISEFPPEWPVPVVEPGFSVRGGGSDSYWNIQKTTSVLESWANVLRRTSQARCSAASKAIRNNSELLCVRSRRNMFWWMRLTIKTASLSIPTRCLADTQCGAETMLGMYYCSMGDMCTWHLGW